METEGKGVLFFTISILKKGEFEMRQKRFWIFLALTLGLFQAGYFQCLASDGKTPKITKEELESMLNMGTVLILF